MIDAIIVTSENDDYYSVKTDLKFLSGSHFFIIILIGLINLLLILLFFFVSGDRWLVSCLGVLYLSKGLFYRVVPADQNFSTPDHYAGVFRFRLWWCGEWVEVLVDDRLPTVHGRLAFLQSTNSDQFWPGLLEKAYAK